MQICRYTCIIVTMSLNPFIPISLPYVAISSSPQHVDMQCHTTRQLIVAVFKCRDQIGNISQSSITRNKGKSTLVLETRYPMYGGWRAQFYIGYSMPTESALLYDNETKHFSLSLPFLPVLEDGWIASLQMKIILPERCQDVSFSTKRIEYAHVEQNNSIRQVDGQEGR